MSADTRPGQRDITLGIYEREKRVRSFGAEVFNTLLSNPKFTSRAPELLLGFFKVGDAFWYEGQRGVKFSLDKKSGGQYSVDLRTRTQYHLDGPEIVITDVGNPHHLDYKRREIKLGPKDFSFKKDRNDEPTVNTVSAAANIINFLGEFREQVGQVPQEESPQ